MLTEDEFRRFRAGESDAVRAVYREYGRLVFAICRNLLNSSQLAEEAAQQTFLKAWRSAHTVDPGRDLAPWLATIARRTSIDVYRQESRETSSALDDVPVAHPALVQQPVAIEQTYDVWQVRQALDELPDDERQIVALQHLEGLTQTAVAERLKLPVGTVKSRSYRAHKKLAARLGHLREGFD
ncbi:MAG TPA: RNA polymerase sigma factor [Nakamurella sp.]